MTSDNSDLNNNNVWIEVTKRRVAKQQQQKFPPPSPARNQAFAPPLEGVPAELVWNTPKKSDNNNNNNNNNCIDDREYDTDESSGLTQGSDDVLQTPNIARYCKRIQAVAANSPNCSDEAHSVTTGNIIKNCKFCGGSHTWGCCPNVQSSKWDPASRKTVLVLHNAPPYPLPRDNFDIHILLPAQQSPPWRCRFCGSGSPTHERGRCPLVKSVRPDAASGRTLLVYYDAPPAEADIPAHYVVRVEPPEENTEDKPGQVPDVTPIAMGAKVQPLLPRLPAPELQLMDILKECIDRLWDPEEECCHYWPSPDLLELLGSNEEQAKVRSAEDFLFNVPRFWLPTGLLDGIEKV